MWHKEPNLEKLVVAVSLYSILCSVLNASMCTNGCGIPSKCVIFADLIWFIRQKVVKYTQFVKENNKVKNLFPLWLSTTFTPRDRYTGIAL